MLSSGELVGFLRFKAPLAGGNGPSHGSYSFCHQMEDASDLCYVELKQGVWKLYTQILEEWANIIRKQRDGIFYVVESFHTRAREILSHPSLFLLGKLYTSHQIFCLSPHFTSGEGPNGIKHIYCMYLYYNLVCQSFEWLYYKIVKVSAVVKFALIISCCTLLGEIKWAKLLMVLTTNYWPGN